MNHPQAGTSWGPPTPTDGDGRFQFDDLSPDLGTYGSRSTLRDGYRAGRGDAEAGRAAGRDPAGARAGRDGPGRRREDRLADPGRQVYATPAVQGRRESFYRPRADRRAGAVPVQQPRRGVYRLGDTSGMTWVPEAPRVAEADQAGPVEARVTLPGGAR